MSSGIRRYAFLVAFAMAAIRGPIAASAGERAGSYDVSTGVLGVAARSGPTTDWTTEQVEVRLPPAGAVGIQYLNRSFGIAAPARTRAQYASIDGYARLSSAVSAYGLVASGTAPFPARRVFAEIDAAVPGMRRLHILGGGGFRDDETTGRSRSLMLGATYYVADGYVTFRYLPTWSPNGDGTAGYLASAAFGHPGTLTETLYVGSGSESEILGPAGSLQRSLGERSVDAALVVRRWTSAHGGYHVTASYGELRRAGGPLIQRARGIELGWFGPLGHH